MRRLQLLSGTGALLGALAGVQVGESRCSLIRVAGGKALRLSVIAFTLIAMSSFRVRAETADDAQAAIRAALADWTRNFNTGKAEKVCDLFATDLRYDFRGYPERGYRDICDRLRRSLGDGQEVISVEPAMDVFRCAPNGAWKIVRYMAYEAPGLDVE